MKTVKGGSVLVIDDEYGVRIVMQKLLEMKGYEVAVAASGKEGIDKLKAGKYSLVLLDISMEVMNGIETLKKIREFDSKTLIIMLTGERNEKIAKNCFELGANNYIIKPFDLDVFDNALSKAAFLQRKNETPGPA